MSTRDEMLAKVMASLEYLENAEAEWRTVHQWAQESVEIMENVGATAETTTIFANVITQAEEQLQGLGMLRQAAEAVKTTLEAE